MKYGKAFSGLALIPFFLHTIMADATVYQGTVTNVTAAVGVVYVFVNNGAFGPAGQGSCPTGTGMVFAITVTPTASDFNKSMIAMALTAKSTGVLVYAAGDGNCANGNPYVGSSSGSEGLVYFDLKG